MRNITGVARACDDGNRKLWKEARRDRNEKRKAPGNLKLGSTDAF